MEPSPPADLDVPAVDVALGLVATVMTGAGAVVRVTRPIAGVVLRPPLTPGSLQPGTWLFTLAQRGKAFREAVMPQVDALMSQVIEGVIARVDIEGIIDSLDLATIARQVVDDIDLPDLIRDSTGALASETVLGLRMQGIEADERVNRVVDKVLLRRNGRKTQVRPHTDEPAS